MFSGKRKKMELLPVGCRAGEKQWDFLCNLRLAAFGLRLPGRHWKEFPTFFRCLGPP